MIVIEPKGSPVDARVPEAVKDWMMYLYFRTGIETMIVEARAVPQADGWSEPAYRPLVLALSNPSYTLEARPPG